MEKKIPVRWTFFYFYFVLDKLFVSGYFVGVGSSYHCCQRYRLRK